MVNTKKLTEDAKLARVLAEAASNSAADGGSANLDATFLRLEKGQRVDGVVAAIQSAGLGCYPTRWLGRGVLIQPPGRGQAGSRYAANQTLYTSLQRAGWPVTPYYQLD